LLASKSPFSGKEKLVSRVKKDKSSANKPGVPNHPKGGARKVRPPRRLKEYHSPRGGKKSNGNWGKCHRGGDTGSHIWKKQGT